MSGTKDYADMRRRIGAILLGSAGNLVEWYDFYAYTAFSLYFAGSFFPDSNPVTAQLKVAVLFAAPFVMRPFGAWFFGYLADRYGRRLSLMVSVGSMCFGSLLIAVSPTYASIGLWAPALLAIARIIQGLSLGGEYGASAAYLSEVADPPNRGFYSSFQYVTLIGGQLVAIIVLLILQNLFLSPEQLKAWGWRIPFAIGALLAIFVAIMRKDLPETEAFKREKTKLTHGALRELLRYPREVFLVIGLTAGGTAAFYTFTTYMQTFVHLTSGMSEEKTTLIIFGTLVFAALLQPLYGAISDRIGRKPLLIFFGVAGTLFTVPILYALRETKSELVAFLLISAAWLFTAAYTSINAIVKAELFPTSIRATGIAVPYALTVSVFGGTAPMIALYFKQNGVESWFFYYLAGMICLSLIVYVTMRDTKSISAMSPN
jgi:MHS family alpha-ketoglutarate permease-like MFS transporter